MNCPIRMLAAFLILLGMAPARVRCADTFCVPVADVNASPGAGSNPMEFVYMNGTTFFSADDGEHGRELWQTNGTDRTTLMVGDIFPGATGSDPQSLTSGGNRLFFSANDGVAGSELWSANFSMTRVVPSGDGHNIAQIIYSPTLFQDLNTLSGGSAPMNLRVANNYLYLSADDGTRGQEPWRSDQPITMATRMSSFWNLNPVLNQGSKPYGFTAIPGSPGVFFTAYTPAGGNEVWYNYGSITATCFPLETSAGNPYDPGDFVPFNGSLVFPATSTYGRELWMCNAGITTPMIARIADINPGRLSAAPDNLTATASGTIFFSATDGGSGNELWKLSMEATVLTKPDRSTPAKTTVQPWKPLGGITSIVPVVSQVADINPGAGDSNPAEFVAVGDTVYFQADDGVHGAELWRSNGMITGTWMVDDIFPGANGSNPSHLTYLGGNLYFAADDGVHGAELWRSDGTKLGTRLVRDIWPGPLGSNPSDLTVAGNHIIFSADHPDLGNEPWITGPPLPSRVPPGLWARYK